MSFEWDSSVCPSGCIQAPSGLLPIQQVMSLVSCTQSAFYLAADNELVLLACLLDIHMHSLQQLLAIGIRPDCMRHHWQHQSKDFDCWIFCFSSSLMGDFNTYHILLDLTMSNALFNAIPLLDGATTIQKWKMCIMAYIMSTRNSYILWKDCLAKNLMD